MSKILAAQIFHTVSFSLSHTLAYSHERTYLQSAFIYSGARHCVHGRQSRQQPWTSYWNTYGLVWYVTSYVTFDFHTELGAPIAQCSSTSSSWGHRPFSKLAQNKSWFFFFRFVAFVSDTINMRKKSTFDGGNMSEIDVKLSVKCFSLRI